MPVNFQIKGLAEKVQAARAQIAAVRQASTDFETEAASLTADLIDGTAQMKALHSDFLFEAQTLGNSPPASVASGAVGANPAETAGLAEVK